MKIFKCGCKTGNFDTGWQERRSAECERRERESFSLVLEKMLIRGRSF